MQLHAPHPSEIAELTLNEYIIELFNKNKLPILMRNAESDLVTSFTIEQYNIDALLAINSLEQDKNLSFTWTVNWVRKGCVGVRRQLELFKFLQTLNSSGEYPALVTMQHESLGLTFSWITSAVFVSEDAYNAGINATCEFINTRSLIAQMIPPLEAIIGGSSIESVWGNTLLMGACIGTS